MDDDQDWRAWAACQNDDPEWWFVTAKPGTYIYERDVNQAVNVCRVCPVIDDCLREALRKGYADGVWGGTTEELRRWLRKPKPGQTVKPPPSPLLGRRQHTLETARQGQEAIRAGMSIREAAATFGVSQDTARQWRRTPLEESEVAV